MELAHFAVVYLVCFLFNFYLAIDKLITDKMQNIFYLTAEHSGFIKDTLNKQD